MRNDQEIVCVALDSADTFIIKNRDRFFLVKEKGDLIIAKLSPEGYREISGAHILDPISKAWGVADYRTVI
jgi:outer membrane protein assembly factor BamB